MKKIVTLGLLIASIAGYAQKDSIAIQYAETITADDLKKHLEILASDAFEGRETGKMGQKKAAKYISDYFRGLGIPPSMGSGYFQVYPLTEESNLESTMSVGGNTFKFIDDFFFMRGFDAGEYSYENVVFLGYGIDSENYSDYNALGGVSLEGKMVMVMDGEPFNDDGQSMVTGETKVSEWAEDWRKKRDLAQEKGAKGLLVIKKGYDSYVGRIKYFIENPGMTLKYPEKRGDEVIPTSFISADLADAVLKAGKGKSLEKIKAKIKKKGKSMTDELSTNLTLNVIRKETEYTGENIIAYIEGSDPELKDEIVMITAHYDHIGINSKGEINNGADDDGSGTVTALELAQAFQKAKEEGHGTRRTVVVMTVSGEEKGLLGSEWYSEFPVYDLDKTVVDLNIDMVGRVDKEHEADPGYVYLIGSDKLSTELHTISEDANSTYTQLDLDYTYNHPDDPNRFYYRSDHYNFAKKGIPVIFYFSGVHDDYHKPGDDVEKIMFDKTAEIGKLVFYTAWELANRDQKIVVDVENEFEN